MIAAKALHSKEDLRISKQELRKEACCSMLHTTFMWVFGTFSPYVRCSLNLELKSHAPGLEKNGTPQKSPKEDFADFA